MEEAYFVCNASKLGGWVSKSTEIRRGIRVISDGGRGHKEEWQLLAKQNMQHISKAPALQSGHLAEAHTAFSAVRAWQSHCIIA